MDVVKIVITEPSLGIFLLALAIALTTGAVTIMLVRMAVCRSEFAKVITKLARITTPAQFTNAMEQLRDFVATSLPVSRRIWQRFLGNLVVPPAFAANQTVRSTAAISEIFESEAILTALCGDILIRRIRQSIGLLAVVGAILTKDDVTKFVTIGMGTALAFGLHFLGTKMAAVIVDGKAKALVKILDSLTRAFPPGEQAAILHQEMQALLTTSSSLEARLAAIESRVKDAFVPAREVVVTAPSVVRRTTAIGVLDAVQGRIRATQSNLSEEIERAYAGLNLPIGRPTRLAPTKSLVVAKRVGPGRGPKDAPESGSHLNELLAFLDLAEHHIETLADAERDLAEAAAKTAKSGDDGEFARAMAVSEIRSTLGRISSRGSHLEQGWQRYQETFFALDPSNRSQLESTYTVLAKYQESAASRMLDLDEMASKCILELKVS